MKKLAAALLLLLVCLLAACGESSPAPITVSTQPSVETPSTENDVPELPRDGLTVTIDGTEYTYCADECLAVAYPAESFTFTPQSSEESSYILKGMDEQSPAIIEMTYSADKTQDELASAFLADCRKNKLAVYNDAPQSATIGFGDYPASRILCDDGEYDITGWFVLSGSAAENAGAWLICVRVPAGADEAARRCIESILGTLYFY